MRAHTWRPDLKVILRRAARPPFRETRFWIVQLLVLLIAGLHLMLDISVTLEGRDFPVGVPVALLIIPVGYAALRYGLSGSAATAAWASILWSPDLLLPHGEGHTGSDLVNLALVDAVAVFVGWSIESERLMHFKALQASLQHTAAEARYRKLFEGNQSPILVTTAKAEATILDANPAALAAFDQPLIGRPLYAVLGPNTPSANTDTTIFTLANGRDYRARRVGLEDESEPRAQIILEDITEERREGANATRYARMVVLTEEDQRRKLSRELHDEPLQLLLHLARSLEAVEEAPGLPEEARNDLALMRDQVLEAAVRLRGLARSLRPPALDQLGLVPALSSLLSEAEETSQLQISFEVNGEQRRLRPEAELGAFRIVQEAIRNTDRHGKARCLDVEVSFGESELCLSVRDDGCGFDPVAASMSPEHLGLLGMEERSRLLGGSLGVDSRPGAGTTVAASIPIEPPGGHRAD